MLKSVLKLFLASILVLAIFAGVFSYEIFSAGQKIFSGRGEASIVKQFSELIFNPVEKLQGEDKDRINILLLGVGGEGHSGGELTDTIMVASIKP
ncbi:hypothetical protein KJ586_01195 [Patescibacteria group bacterium]|nr:hypothetical protein [Patescibacteria group bacterium]